MHNTSDRIYISEYLYMNLNHAVQKASVAYRSSCDFDTADDAEPDAETASDSLTDIMLRYRPGHTMHQIGDISVFEHRSQMQKMRHSHN